MRISQNCCIIKMLEVFVLTKKDIKRILMGMRTHENEDVVNYFLGRLDGLEEAKLQTMIAEIGDNEESIRKYLEEKIAKENNNRHEEHTPINDMFTYGVSGSCVHLHMPVNLREMMSGKGITKTMDTVNLYLLDAIEKIRTLQNDGFYKFEGIESIYMISPILVRREIEFLNGLDFETQLYKKSQLQNKEFVAGNPNAQLAVNIFGRDSNVGTAKIGLDIINSQEWQRKRIQTVEDFKTRGIELSKDEAIKI